MPTFRVPSRGSFVITAGSVMNGAASPGQQVWIGRAPRSTSSPVNTTSWAGPLRTRFGCESAIDFSLRRPLTFSARPCGGCISSTSPSLRPASSRLSTPSARHIRRSVPNWLISSGWLEFGFSNSNAGPPALTTRSVISVISRCGSTSACTRTSSPSRSSIAIQSRRSRIAVSLWSRRGARRPPRRPTGARLGAALERVLDGVLEREGSALSAAALEVGALDPLDVRFVLDQGVAGRGLRLALADRLDRAPKGPRPLGLAALCGQCSPGSERNREVHPVARGCEAGEAFAKLGGGGHRIVGGDEPFRRREERHAAPPREAQAVGDRNGLMRELKALLPISLRERDHGEVVQGDGFVLPVATLPLTDERFPGEPGGAIEVSLVPGGVCDANQKMICLLLLPEPAEELEGTLVIGFGVGGIPGHVVCRSAQAQGVGVERRVDVLAVRCQQRVDALSQPR